MEFRQIIPSLIEITGGKHDRADPEIVSKYQGDFKYAFILLIDALGKYQMEYFRRPNPGDYYDIKTIVPSLTPTAILSLILGMKPDEHGIIGGIIRTSLTKGLFRTIDTTTFSRVQVPLDRVGIESKALLLKEPPSFEGNLVVATDVLLKYGLSSFFREYVATIHGHLSFVRHLDALSDGGVMELYYRGYDSVAHDFGPYSREAQLELRLAAMRLRSIAMAIPERMRDKSLFVILGDHGQDEIVIDALNRSDIRNQVGSAGKIYFVYSETALNVLEENLPEGEYEFMPGEEFRKLLGDSETNEEELMYRIGDYVVIPKGGRMPWIGSHPPDLKGMHGGLTDEEMRVRVQFLTWDELMRLTDEMII